MTGGRDRPAEERAVRAERLVALERRRRRVLQGLVGALIRSGSVAQAAQVVVDRGRTATGARGALLASLRPTGPTVLAISPDPAGCSFRGLAPGDPPPAALANALGTRTGVFGLTHPDHPGTWFVVLPLMERRRRSGVLAWELDASVQLDQDDRSFLRTIAMHAGLGLERARSTEQTRAALAEADAGRRRLDVLVNAGRLLGASLDLDETLAGLARAAIPTMGDYCVVDSIAPGGRFLRHVASAGTGRPEVAAALQASPLTAETVNPITDAMASGRTLVVDMDAAYFERFARGATHLEALRATDGRHALAVPLHARGRSLGCLTFMTSDPGRPYDAADIALGAVLAQRAAKAIENSHLHAEVRQLAAQERDRAAELRSVLAAIGEGIVRIDPGGGVTSTNEAAVRMLGGPVVTEGELWARLAGSGPTPSTSLGFPPTEYPLGSPARRWLEVAGYPLSHGAADDEAKESGSVLVLRDVTAFRQGQGLREAFLGLLSHELRTPVTSIYAAAIGAGPAGPTGSTRTIRADILDDIVAESDRLYRLVEDLLVLARFDEGLELVRRAQPAPARSCPDVVASEAAALAAHARFEVDGSIATCRP